MNIMEYGKTVWDIMGDIAAFIDVARLEQSSAFTGLINYSSNNQF